MEAHDNKTTETHIRDSYQPKAKAKAKAKDPKVKNTNSDNISVKDSSLPSIVKNHMGEFVHDNRQGKEMVELKKVLDPNIPEATSNNVPGKPPDSKATTLPTSSSAPETTTNSEPLATFMLDRKQWWREQLSHYPLSHYQKTIQTQVLPFSRS